MLLEITNLSKSFTFNNEKIDILDKVNLKCRSGEITAITGCSGSGKSTLLNIISLLDRSNEGQIVFDGKELTRMKKREQDNFRKLKMGIVFQQYNLINNLTAYQNIKIPLYANGEIERKERKEKIYNQIRDVGLQERIMHFPSTMSGGEQQRIAIARAMINKPDIILADEPTGNVDEDNERKIMELFREYANLDKMVIMVTHSQKILKYVDKVFKLVEGRLESVNAF